MGTETSNFSFTFTFSTGKVSPVTSVLPAASTVRNDAITPNPLLLSVLSAPSSLPAFPPNPSNPHDALVSLPTSMSRRTQICTTIPACIKQSIRYGKSSDAHKDKTHLLRNLSSFSTRKPSLLTIPNTCVYPRPGGLVRDYRQQKRKMEAIANRHTLIIHLPKEREAEKIVNAPTLEDLATSAQQQKAIIDEAMSRPHIVDLELFDTPTSGVEALLKAAEIIKGTSADQDTRLKRPQPHSNGAQELLKAAKQLDKKLLPLPKPAPVFTHNPIIANLAKGYSPIDLKKIYSSARSPISCSPIRESTSSCSTSRPSLLPTSPFFVKEASTQLSYQPSPSRFGSQSVLALGKKSSINQRKGKGTKVSFNETVFCCYFARDDPPTVFRASSPTSSPSSSPSCHLGASINKPATFRSPYAWGNAEAGPSRLPEIEDKTLNNIHPSPIFSDLPPHEPMTRQNDPKDDIFIPLDSPVLPPELRAFAQRPPDLRKKTKHALRAVVHSGLVQQDLGGIETSNDGAPAPIPVVPVDEPNITLPAAAPSYFPVAEAPREVLAVSATSASLGSCLVTGLGQGETEEVGEGGFFFEGLYYQASNGNTVSSSDAANMQGIFGGVVGDLSSNGSSTTTSSSYKAYHETPANTGLENGADSTSISTTNDGSATGTHLYSGENITSTISTTIPFRQDQQTGEQYGTSALVIPVRYSPISPFYGTPPETSFPVPAHSTPFNERSTYGDHNISVYHPFYYNTDVTPNLPWTTPRPLLGVPPLAVPSFESVATGSNEGTTTVTHQEWGVVGPSSLATMSGSMAAGVVSVQPRPLTVEDEDCDMEDVGIVDVFYTSPDAEMVYVGDLMDETLDEPVGEEPAQVEVIPEPSPPPPQSHQSNTWGEQTAVQKTQSGSSQWDSSSNDYFQGNSSAPGWDLAVCNLW